MNSFDRRNTDAPALQDHRVVVIDFTENDTDIRRRFENPEIENSKGGCSYMTHQQELLKQAAEEIAYLRRQHELMAAKLDVFEKCISLFRAPGMGYGEMASRGPDLLRAIEIELTEVTTESPTK